MAADPKPRNFIRRHPFATLLAVLSVAGLAGSLLPKPPPAPAPSASVPPPKPDETVPRRWPASGAAQFIGPYLKDASSAQYQNVTYRRRMGISTVCGEVSAKNSFGAYTGFVGFIDVGGIVSFEARGSGFARRWNHWCVMTDKTDPLLIKLARRHHAG